MIRLTHNAASRSARRALLLLAGAALCAAPARATAQTLQSEVPEPMRGVDVAERRGESLPLNLEYTDARGRTVRLADYFDGRRPVVLLLGYYDCPLLCDVVFNKTLQAFKSLKLTLGEDYRAVTISFDHTNTTAQAAGKQAAMLAGYDGERGEAPWAFLTSSATNAKAIAEAVGYTYKYLPESGEFSHPAAIVVVSPDGVVSNYLYGVQFPERQMRLALLDAADGKVGDFFDKVLLYCYHYDPAAGSYAIQARKVMNIAGALTAIGLGSVIAGLFWMERRRRRAGAADASTTNHSASPGAAPAH